MGAAEVQHLLDQLAQLLRSTQHETRPKVALDIDTVRAELDAFIEQEGLEPLPPAPEVSPELYALGQSLAFDKILSGNEDISSQL